MIKKIIPLTLGGLAIGTTEFVIMGLLPDIAHTLNISIPKAGHFISAYALGVVIGAPLLVALSSKFPPKKILMALMAIFIIFNGISALMPDYYSFLGARFFSGLPHGAFFGVGSVVAKNLAPPEKQGIAISGMFSGLTVANLAMVVAVGFGGLFSWFSYITPLMTQVSHFEPSKIPSIMILAGFGMLIGNFLGGWMADKMRPALASTILFAFFIVLLVLVFLYSGNQKTSLILTFFCGMLSMSVGSPINIIMIRAAKKSEMLGAAFMQAAFNVANSIGAYIGGIPLERGYGYEYPALVGAIMAFLGMLLCIVFMYRFKPFTQKISNDQSYT